MWLPSCEKCSASKRCVCDIVDLINDLKGDTIDVISTSIADARRWSALALIVTAQFMVILDVAIVNVALPSIKSDLGFSQASLQWVISAYAIFFGGALLLGGRLADLLGRRRLFVAGLAVFAASSLLCGLAWSEASLIAFRALQGLGGALLAPAALSLLMTTFAEGRERNLALGIYGAASGQRRRGRRAARRRAHLVPELVVDLLHQRPGRRRRDRAHAGAPAREPAPTSRTATSTSPARRPITAGLMLLVYALTRATTDGWGSPRRSALLAALGRADRARSSRSSSARRRRCCRCGSSGSRRSPAANVDDGDHRRGRVLGVLRAHAVPAGRPALLGGAERRRVRRLRAARSSSSRTSRRSSSAGSASARRSPRACSLSAVVGRAG